MAKSMGMQPCARIGEPKASPHGMHRNLHVFGARGGIAVDELLSSSYGTSAQRAEAGNLNNVDVAVERGPVHGRACKEHSD